MDINLFPKFIDKAATPVAQSVGKTLSSVWTMVFGGVDLYSDKISLKRARNLEKFKLSLEEKVTSVPDANLIEPPLHVIGPTMEAAKFYFESHELREMFASLIAASINTELIQQAHPSFVEIIKQLSPLDAQNLMTFKNKSHHPIANYLMSNGTSYQDYLGNIFLENKKSNDSFLNSISISNLERLGLVSIDYNATLFNKSAYDQFFDTDIYNNYSSIITVTSPSGANSTYPTEEKFKVEKGVVSLTEFGNSFKRVCL